MAMSYNVLGISEVPSEARNLDGALAKSDMRLLGVGDSPEVSVSERRVVDGGQHLPTFVLNNILFTVYSLYGVQYFYLQRY